MKIVLLYTLLCTLVVLAPAVLCAQTDADLKEEGGGKRLSDASSAGMGYGAILIGVFILIVLPTIGLLFTTKVVGIKEVGIIRSIYTSLVFFAVSALVFYSVENLGHALMNPGEFFNNSNLLSRLVIVFVLAFMLLKFVLSSTIVRSFLGAMLYLLAFYGSILLAFYLITAAGAEDLLKESVK